MDVFGLVFTLFFWIAAAILAGFCGMLWLCTLGGKPASSRPLRRGL